MQGLGKLFFIFFKIGAFTFGGGYAMLPIIYRELCEKNQYFPEDEMEEIVVLAQAMPGAMAVNCATEVGYKLYGKFGAVICALGVVLPSYLIIVLLAGLLLTYSDNKYVLGAFAAISAVVAGMIAAAGVKLFKPIAKDKVRIAGMAATIVLYLLTGANPIFFIICGGILGYVLSKKREERK